MSSINSDSERAFIYGYCTQSPLEGFIGLEYFEGNYKNEEETIRMLEIGKRYCDVLKNMDNQEKVLRIEGGSGIYEGLMMMLQSDKEKKMWKETGEKAHKIMRNAIVSVMKGLPGPSQEEIKYCKQALKKLSEIAEERLEVLK